MSLMRNTALDGAEDYDDFARTLAVSQEGLALIARLETAEQGKRDAETRLALTHPTDAKLETLRQMLQRALVGGNPQAVAETLLDELQSVLRDAEARAEKAEAWVIRLAYDYSMQSGTMCHACRSHSTGRVAHEPGCYIAELEARRD